MPRRSAKRPKYRETYWWTSGIGEIRKTCNSLRRTAQRAKKADRVTANGYLLAHKEARKSLRKTIAKSRWNCIKQFCENLNQDVWRTLYRIVMSKLRGNVSQGRDNAPKDSPGLFSGRRVAGSTIGRRRRKRKVRQRRSCSVANAVLNRVLCAALLCTGTNTIGYYRLINVICWI